VNSFRTILGQFQFFPSRGGDLAGEVDLLFWSMVGLSGLVLLAIALVTFYFLAKYRHTAAVDRTAGPSSSLRLEIAWTVIPLLIFMGTFGWGATLYFRKNQVPADAIEVHVVGKQWMWKLQHLQGKREINELHVPVGRTIKLLMTSEDVIHSFFLPDFRVKQDVLPGKYTTEWFRPTKTGTFRIYCAQYCGRDHALMVGRVVVLEPEVFKEWLNSGGETVGVARQGENLFRAFGCSGCHSVNASVRSPLLNGIFGKPVTLQDGRIVTADESYLRDCMLVPRSQVVAGFDPLMPSFQGRLSEDELFQLVTYIKSLTPHDNGAINKTQ
jgi:cytochrome c oxidase subunit II